jgi:diacylglycerol kinase (CTP)
MSASAPLEPIAHSSNFPTPVKITRFSRKDKHLHSTTCFPQLTDIRRFFAGAIRYPSLPEFDYTMSFTSRSAIPATPRVISPSPTPSERGSQDGTQDSYFGPVTRSSKKRAAAQLPIDEGIDGEEEDSNPDLRRARSKSRSPIRLRKMAGLTSTKTAATTTVAKSEPIVLNGKTTNGHLSPFTAAKSTGWSWRDISRSPSPLGLIPIHRQWRVFIHRHEVPRKVLHVSIGFFTLWAYTSGIQTSAITPWLVGFLIPIAATDYLRFTYPALNRFYVRALGALMRETEYDGWNGVIWYLLGVSIVLGFFPKDVGVVGVLLLSWCDTAASTVGRAYGRYTPRIRKGKSLAGSLAAFAVGVITAWAFWGWLAPRTGPFPTDIDWPFMYRGVLRLPATLRDTLGLTEAQSSVSGGVALVLMSVFTGFIASASEVVDLFGWDDNLTIPVLSGIGIWGFLKVFG